MPPLRGTAPLSGVLLRTQVPDSSRNQGPSYIAHERTRQVYEAPLTPFGGSRKEEVALAQLRSGHSLFLAHYRHKVDQTDSPDCPRFGLGPEDLQHFLCDCPATRRTRAANFGSDGASLSSLRRNPAAVTLFLRELNLCDGVPRTTTTTTATTESDEPY